MSFYEGGTWEDCTDPEEAEASLQSIERALKEFDLRVLEAKFKDRSLKILEIGSGNGEFLKVLQNNGFQSIRGVDMNPRHTVKYPELESLVDCDVIQRFARKAYNPFYDLIYSKLIFDKDCYIDQRNEGCRELMLKAMYGLLDPQGLYYGNERHQVEENKVIIKNIVPRANTLIGTYKPVFIPAFK